MRVLGVDLASADENTAMAIVDSDDGSWTLAELYNPCSDEKILASVSGSPDGSLLGFDCPLGWPRGFGEFLADHRTTAKRSVPEKNDLIRRLTDARVAELVRKNTDPPVRLNPLSVSSDRIAVPAFRMARLERSLTSGATPDRSGAGMIAEVYPAAALALWELPHRGYKGPKGRPVRDEIVRGLQDKAGDRLNISRFSRLLSDNDHCLDALLCALVTIAVFTGRCLSESTPQSSSERSLANEEGWIQLPIADLATILAPT